MPYQNLSVIAASGGEIARTNSDALGTFVIERLPKGPFVLRGEATDASSRSRFNVPVVLAADDEVADAFVPVGILAPGESHLFEITAPARDEAIKRGRRQLAGG